MSAETIFERLDALEALTGTVYEAVPGADCTGDPSPEMAVAGLGAQVGLTPAQALDLRRPLTEIIADG